MGASAPCTADCGKHTVMRRPRLVRPLRAAPNMQFTGPRRGSGYEDLTLPGGAC